MNNVKHSISNRFPALNVTNDGSSAIYLNNIPNTPVAPSYLSQVVIAGETAYLSGQIAIDPVTDEMVSGGFEVEAEQVFNNIEETLRGIGLSFANIVKVSVYLTNLDKLPAFNEIYRHRMGGCRPAREAVEVNRLDLGATVEVTVTAFYPGGFS